MKCVVKSGQMEMFTAYKVLFLRINTVGNSVAVHSVSPCMVERDTAPANSRSVKDEIGLQKVVKLIPLSILK